MRVQATYSAVCKHCTNTTLISSIATPPYAQACCALIAHKAILSSSDPDKEMPKDTADACAAVLSGPDKPHVMQAQREPYAFIGAVKPCKLTVVVVEKGSNRQQRFNPVGTFTWSANINHNAISAVLHFQADFSDIGEWLVSRLPARALTQVTGVVFYKDSHGGSGGGGGGAGGSGGSSMSVGDGGGGGGAAAPAAASMAAAAAAMATAAAATPAATPAAAPAAVAAVATDGASGSTGSDSSSAAADESLAVCVFAITTPSNPPPFLLQPLLSVSATPLDAQPDPDVLLRFIRAVGGSGAAGDSGRRERQSKVEDERTQTLKLLLGPQMYALATDGEEEEEEEGGEEEKGGRRRRRRRR